MSALRISGAAKVSPRFEESPHFEAEPPTRSYSNVRPGHFGSGVLAGGEGRTAWGHAQN